VKKLGGHRDKPDPARSHDSAGQMGCQHGGVPTGSAYVEAKFLSLRVDVSKVEFEM
jgi:hypothetical protein